MLRVPEIAMAPRPGYGSFGELLNGGGVAGCLPINHILIEFPNLDKRHLSL